ncbi:hypothetical protein DTO013E5_5477 [Penicillium roqueforti]|uniref:uncharacterized protein n=1 Tax=Penicillium roqueforti TaxID=5082 RepID=UPI00190DC7E8|nr:uncharacterized protein LCP9604111_3399 [Penicillium roqueforti]KAF9250497.1 hypothetical protein LCP9604111_3399 [Penicillium roqueforti]KAI1833184.1 hypothetical protein CBS147337_6141 [Penicillium roqueforti]KAI2672720.1 hypothetical protein CBS147355_8047 [Penicillium roqueforti]KAI2679028.1 hypothetical protein LCP963914a_7607 [Penicillium roqueforti]KAI2698836.1 hypothetical protein CBS147372_6683 [Penicillium roqueforti]
MILGRGHYPNRRTLSKLSQDAFRGGLCRADQRPKSSNGTLLKDVEGKRGEAHTIKNNKHRPSDESCSGSAGPLEWAPV